MSTLPGPASVALPELLPFVEDEEVIRSSHEIDIKGDKVIVRDVELFSTGESGPLGKVDADTLSTMVEATNTIMSRGRATMIVIRHQDDEGGAMQDTIGRIAGSMHVAVSPFSDRPTVFGDMEFGRAEFDAWIRPNRFSRRSAEIVPIESDDGPKELVGQSWIFQIALLGRELPRCDLRDIHIFAQSGRVVTPQVGGDTLPPIEIFRIPEPQNGEGEEEYLGRTDTISRHDCVDPDRARVYARQMWTAKKGDDMPDDKPFDEKLVKAVKAMTDDERRRFFKSFADDDDDDKKKDDKTDDDKKKSDSARDDDDRKDDDDEKKKKANNAKVPEIASYSHLQDLVKEQGDQIVAVLAQLGKTQKDAAERDTRAILKNMRDVDGFQLDLDAELPRIVALPEDQRDDEIKRMRENYRRITTPAGIVAGSNGVAAMAREQRTAEGKELDIDAVTKKADEIVRDNPGVRYSDTDLYARAMKECGFGDLAGIGIATPAVR